MRRDRKTALNSNSNSARNQTSDTKINLSPVLNRKDREVPHRTLNPSNSHPVILDPNPDLETIEVNNKVKLDNDIYGLHEWHEGGE